jgi:23S rRNA (cytidine1920-2'-O)/16S rRNA (cytidine1409-2'-O)-methyltransferase
MAAARRSTSISKVKRIRADSLVLQQGLADSRSRAAALILAGAVMRPDKTVVDKAGSLLPADEPLSLSKQPLPYVSRGGLKLAAALQHFGSRRGLEVAGAICLDVGASTGGFTDCLLQHGAARIYAVDVGYNQLAYRLRTDPRVLVRERLNIRLATAADLPEQVDLLVIDVSFISLRTVLPVALPFLRPGGRVVALVKPQFEVGRLLVGKAGIVRDPASRAGALQTICAAAAALGLQQVDSIDSPITGQKGNHEFLMYAEKLP